MYYSYNVSLLMQSKSILEWRIRVKITTFLEYQGKQIEDSILVEKAKELWINAGNKVTDIASLKLYAKPQEDKIYFVINEDFSDSFSVE